MILEKQSSAVCLYASKGYQADGHDYIEEAARRGAVAIVVQQSYNGKRPAARADCSDISPGYAYCTGKDSSGILSVILQKKCRL